MEEAMKARGLPYGIKLHVPISPSSKMSLTPQAAHTEATSDKQQTRIE